MQQWPSQCNGGRVNAVTAPGSTPTVITAIPLLQSHNDVAVTVAIADIIQGGIFISDQPGHYVANKAIMLRAIKHFSALPVYLASAMCI
jgi:hypothetical protein